MPLIKEREDQLCVQCDQCAARAKWRASLLNGPLYFCNHHFVKVSNGNAIQTAALEIVKV